MSYERSSTARSRPLPGPRVSVSLAAVLVFVACALSALAPWLDEHLPSAGAAVRASYGLVCHQIPSRSFGPVTHPHALCARCEGLYAGGCLALALVALLAPRSLRSPNRWLWLLLVPTVADVLVRAAGGPGLESHARWFVALPAGFAAGVFLAVGVADCSLILVRGRAGGLPGPVSRAGELVENSHG